LRVDSRCEVVTVATSHGAAAFVIPGGGVNERKKKGVRVLLNLGNLVSNLKHQ
jgi:hypothetical protein